MNPNASYSLTFLGTGTSTGVPLLGCNCSVCTSTDTRDKRLRTSALFQSGNVRIIFDVGPDFRQQMFRAHIAQLNACLLTHAHKDHAGGLDEVRALNVFSQMPFDIYLDTYAEKTIRKQYDYVFEGKDYPGIPKIQLHTINQNAFYIDDICIQPMQVMHHHLPVTAFRIGGLSYITDANFISDQTHEQLQGTDVLVINALRKEKHISHFTLDEALTQIEKINPRVAYLTHISHHMGLHEHIQKELPTNVFLAYDQLTLNILPHERLDKRIPAY